MTTLKLFKVFNKDGQQLGTWHAKNEKHAIALAESQLNSGAASFRRSWTRVKLDGATARILARD